MAEQPKKIHKGDALWFMATLFLILTGLFLTLWWVAYAQNTDYANQATNNPYALTVSCSDGSTPQQDLNVIFSYCLGNAPSAEFYQGLQNCWHSTKIPTDPTYADYQYFSSPIGGSDPRSRIQVYSDWYTSTYGPNCNYGWVLGSDQTGNPGPTPPGYSGSQQQPTDNISQVISGCLQNTQT